MLFPLLSVCRDKCFPNECFYLLLRALYMFFYIIALFLVILCFASELSLSLVVAVAYWSLSLCLQSGHFTDSCRERHSVVFLFSTFKELFSLDFMVGFTLFRRNIVVKQLLKFFLGKYSIVALSRCSFSLPSPVRTTLVSLLRCKIAVFDLLSG